MNYIDDFADKYQGDPRHVELYTLLSDLSESKWAAGWILGWEYEFWPVIQHDTLPEQYSNWVSQEEFDRVKALVAALDGWIIWREYRGPEDRGGPLFINRQEWEALYAEELRRRSERREARS